MERAVAARRRIAQLEPHALATRRRTASALGRFSLRVVRETES